MATKKSGVLFPEDKDPLTGTTVAEVLDSKHPPSQTPSPTLLPTYPSTPAFINLDITPDTVEWVAHQLHGAVGVGDADAMLSHIGSQGLVKPARSCMLLLLVLLAGLPMVFLPGLPTEPS